ncbi:helix-turn-helix transcriptional regulator [Vibrio aphrogenes]|uniref:helix-turn-helix transcriptional regulator n=1 Tax=Vibrio aphrogenes TaxID=1891186 RepID=UPI000B361CC1|nr:WYL domain-containing protein [Vibrio aphrogenes]
MKVNQQYIRWQFIELLLYWEGGFTKRQITEQFGISRQQAHQDIKAYEAQYYPISMVSKSRHIVEGDFQPTLMTPDIEIYLNWLMSQQFNPSQPQDLHHKATSISLPSRNVSPVVIQRLIQAVREHKRLEVNYISLSHPDEEGRIFHPHTFVNTGLRWHVRGYCEKSQGYRDLVLTRFRDAPEVLDQSQYGSQQDEAWNTDVIVILAPDPRLNTEKQNVLINDYQMINGQLVLTTRAALVNYLLKAMQVNTKYLDGVPEAQQLVLVNRDDVKQWLYE